MKISKLFFRLSFLVLISFILISSKNIKKNTDTSAKVTVLDYYSLNEKKLKSIFFTIHVEDLLSSNIEEENLFSLALNLDANGDAIADEVIVIFPKKGKMYFYGPFSGKISEDEYIYDSNSLLGNVLITPISSEPITSVASGKKLFAGIKLQDESSILDLMGQSLFNSKFTNAHNSTNIVMELPKNILFNTNTSTFNSWIAIKKL